MSLVVTGATGHLGRLIVESLLDRGVPAADITATGRSTEPLAELAARGVHVAVADFHDPATLDAAFAGADTVVLVSSGSFDDRAGQHRNAIDAAVRAGVTHLLYTSGPHARTSRLLLMADHAATEEAIEAAGIPATILRNGWYVENYTGQLPTYLEHGAVGAAGDGQVSVALRREYAEAAAVAATTEGHVGKVYELGGEAVTVPQLVALIGDAAGQEIAYTDVPVAALTGILVGAGFPEPVAQIFADVDRGISEGELFVDTSDLETLLGRPATPAAEAVTIALAG